MTDKKCRDLILRARVGLIIDQPFFGALALQLKLVEVDNENFCSTMAVDGIHMYYWPPFVKTLTEKELLGVVAHEVMHCVFKHFGRRKARHLKRWNWAGDFVINGDLIKAGFTLPGSPITLDSPPGTKGHLLDPKYDGMSTEEVYERMPEIKTIYITIGDGDGGGGGGLPEGADLGGCGGVIDASPHSVEKSDQTERQWEANTRMAIGVATKRNGGIVPGYLKRLVVDLGKPKISWRDLTRDFIDTCMKSDYSWAKPSRRGMSQGMVLPGFVPDALNHMIFIADNSGSITDRLISAYLGEISGALNDGVADKLTIIYADAAVNHVDEFLPGDIVTYNAEKGGGGTDFVPALNWITENAPDANCVVYLTDMYPNHWNLPMIEAPLMWAAYMPEAVLATVKVPYGDVIHVDSSY